MKYLAETLSVYKCPECEANGRAESWIDDDYEGLVCEHCGVAVKHDREEPATYWSVGVYETGRSYGGPEEGGWWYDTGSRIDPHKQRVFEDIAEARKYQQELRDHYNEHQDVAVLGFTEQLPVAGYPNRRPRYC